MRVYVCVFFDFSDKQRMNSFINVLSGAAAQKLNEYNKNGMSRFTRDKRCLLLQRPEDKFSVAIVRNNYLNNWAFKEKIDCLKAVFCGESIRGNHFSCLLDIVFLLISARKDA